LIYCSGINYLFQSPVRLTFSAATAMLAQANQSAQSVLALLK
jgi:hypothetical protein